MATTWSSMRSNIHPSSDRSDAASCDIAPGKRHVEPDRLASCIDERTRVIGVSYVSYLTAERHDLPALRALADKVGALLVVDFTQSSGYLPIAASVADFAFSACYKVDARHLPAWRSRFGTARGSRIGRRQPPAGIRSEPGQRGYDDIRPRYVPTRCDLPAAIPRTRRFMCCLRRWIIWRRTTCARCSHTCRL